MRATVPALLIGLLAALTAPAPVPRPEPDVTRDLKLVATRAAGTKVDAGTELWVGLVLANTSKTFTYPVVKPGDGTEAGWREPYVYFTAERLAADGRWLPVEQDRYSRCGLCDSDWPKDVVDLHPGGRLLLGGPYAGVPVNVQHPGRVRVFGHSPYRASGGKYGPPRPDAERGRMRGVPPFVVTSEPVEFEVSRPLDVRVRVKRPMAAEVRHPVSDILEVTVVNLTPAALPIADPSGYPYPTLRFELDATLGWRPSFDESSFVVACRNLPSELPAGGQVSLLGTDRLDGTWEYPRSETVRLRAVFRPGVRGKSAAVKSEWVEVRVE